MKKKPDRFASSARYRGLKLYRDDIDYIISIVNEYGYSIKISDSEFEFDSLEELCEKRGKTPANFEVEGSHEESNGASISISFDKDEIRLHSVNMGLAEGRAIEYKIREILDKKTSFLYKFMDPFLFALPSFIVIGALPTLLSKEGQDSIEVPDYLPYLVAFILISWLISIFYRKTFYSAILAQRHEGGFIKRNSDKLLLLVIGGFIGAFIKHIF